MGRHYVSHPHETSYNSITLCTSNVNVSNRGCKQQLPYYCLFINGWSLTLEFGRNGINKIRTYV